MVQFYIREKKCTRAFLVGFEKTSLAELSGLTKTLGMGIEGELLDFRNMAPELLEYGIVANMRLIMKNRGILE